MNNDTPNVAGIDSVDIVPHYEATGDREIRAKNVHKRHLKLLDDLETELGNVGRRESIAALCEYYYRHPQEVVDYVQGPQVR